MQLYDVPKKVDKNNKGNIKIYSRLGKSCLHKYKFFERKDDNKHCESKKMEIQGVVYKDKYLNCKSIYVEETDRKIK